MRGVCRACRSIAKPASTALASINGVNAAEHLGRTANEVVSGLRSDIREYIAQVVEQRERIRELRVQAETRLEPGTKRTRRGRW